MITEQHRKNQNNNNPPRTQLQTVVTTPRTKKQKTQAHLQKGLMTTTPRVVATAPGCAPPLQWQRAVEHLKHLIFVQTLIKKKKKTQETSSRPRSAAPGPKPPELDNGPPHCATGAPETK